MQRWALRKIVCKFRKLGKLRKFAQMRNLRCALCLFFQRLRNLRLRIGKSNICCALIVNFFPRCAITKYFLNVDLHVPFNK